jgi:hypothetical protein
MDRFDRDGRMIIPLNARRKETSKEDEAAIKYVVTEAYCPAGCSVIDKEHPINGFPGLKIAFKRPGMDGVLVLSAIEGDFEKLVLSGALKENVRDELLCPSCGVPFAKLVSCNCREDADLVAIGLTKHLDFNNAITFCNVTGCANGTFIKSGDVLRHSRLYEG